MFQHSAYRVNEGVGEVLLVLVLSRSSSIVVAVYVYNMDGSAMGEY